MPVDTDDSIRIVQITDCHLHGDPELLYRGINPHDSLKTILQELDHLRPDLLLASGDLSEDGSPASYKTLRQLFNGLGVPVLALPGNHDDASLLNKTFPASPVDSVEVTKHGVWHIIRLDSCVPGQHDGRLSAKTIKTLKKLLDQYSDHPKLIALHHQPILIGSPWIDKYRLREPREFIQLVSRHPAVKAVVWGHVHQEFRMEYEGIAMLGAPSSVANSLPGMSKFTADPAGPGCRWLELKKDGSLETQVFRIRATATRE